DDGELFIGCAGGMDTRIQYSYDTQKSSPGSIAYEINVTGLAGGHSGDEIHKGLGNANKIISRFLYDIDALYPFSLTSIRGGNLRNAIPREASAVITIEKEHEEVILSYLNKFAVTIREELKTADPKVMINFKQVEAPKKVFKKGHTRKLLKALQVCPNGVIRMSDDIPGLVETSTNLASIKNIDDNTLEIVTSQRSSIVSRKKEISKRVAATFDLIGAEIIHESPYPGWKPNLDSKILAVTEKSYKKLFKEDAKVKAIHAGLECGLFLEKYPDLDMISFGPTIRGAHSPDERMHIPAVEKFWKLLVDVLEEVE
ncbi:MAG: beta-Ala-His dipeptidase, partial [Bacteroidales bacterium]|nr:beta-Ala-His dipeptidase [Bacteroidales bacterium]